MPTIQYASVPDAATFQRDSSVTFATRSSDPILTKIDWLLAQYTTKESRDPKRKVILCDLFVSANYWLKSYYDKHPGMKKERYPAISGLFEILATSLSVVFACRRPEVGFCIMEIFGRDMTDTGGNVDRMQSAKYYDQRELSLLRLRFKTGRVYRYQVNSTKGPMRLVPLNSAEFFDNVQVMGANGQFMVRQAGWAPFVMTLEREFYMSRHTLHQQGLPNIFHSAYTRGGTVSAAGTMLVRNGQVLGLRGDSGHYQPRENNVAMAITALAMLSVPLMPIQILSFDNKALGNALDFVRSRLTWYQFEAAAKDFRSHRAPQVNAAQANGPVAPAQDMAEHDALYQTD